MPARIAAKRARLLAALNAQRLPTGGGASKIPIRDIAAHAVREPVSRREYVFAVVRTDSEFFGVGEASVPPGLDAATVTAAVTGCKKNLAGREATAVETAQQLVSGPIDTAALQAARAAINMALLDITGKAARSPVYEVLGGPTRFKARAAVPLTGTTIEELRASLQTARAAGFRIFVVPLSPPPYRNQGQAYVRAARRLLQQLREASDDLDFILDCNGVLSPGDAQVLAKELESFHLLWLEEPCSPLNLSAAAKISQESVTPVGFGRQVSHNHQFQDLLRMDAIDVLRPDIGLHGITQIRKAAALAETYYVAVAPFHRGGPVATAACLQVAASIPNFFVQEVPFPVADQDRRMRAEIVSSPIESVREGYLSLPAGPGLGITLNQDAIQRYRAV